MHKLFIFGNEPRVYEIFERIKKLCQLDSILFRVESRERIGKTSERKNEIQIARADFVFFASKKRPRWQINNPLQSSHYFHALAATTKRIIHTSARARYYLAPCPETWITIIRGRGIYESRRFPERGEGGDGALFKRVIYQNVNPQVFNSSLVASADVQTRAWTRLNGGGLRAQCISRLWTYLGEAIRRAHAGCLSCRGRSFHLLMMECRHFRVQREWWNWIAISLSNKLQFD